MISRRILLLVVPSWTALISAVCLARLFNEPALTSADFALIFLTSVVAGIVMGDLENAIVGFALTLVASAVILGFVLSLPSTSGLAGPLFDVVVGQEALGDVFKVFIPFGIVLLLGGAILGSSLAERFGLD